MDITLIEVLPPLLVGLIVATLVGSAAARLGFPLPDERRRLGSIDGLRGYLALLVMVHHFAIWATMPESGTWTDVPVPLLMNFGAGCVCLFFMITGCLFFAKALGGRETDWRALYISRAFRILPLQLVVVLIVSGVALSRVGMGADLQLSAYPINAAKWLTSWAQPPLFGYERSALVNALVLWSLKAEWEFYLIGLPLIAIACAIVGRQARWAVPLVLLVGGLVFRVAAPMPWSMLSIYAVFACGMLGSQIRQTRAAAIFQGPVASVIAAIALGSVAIFTTRPDYPLPLIGYALFFVCVACGNRFFGLFSTRGALVLGEASFGIYMLHGIVLDLAFMHFWGPIADWDVSARLWLLPVLMAIAAGVSIALHLLVEKPAIRLGRTLSERIGAGRSRAANSAIEVAP